MISMEEGTDIKIEQLTIGDKLYHYTSAMGFQGICNKEFWVTEHNFLNDSKEFQIGTEIMVEMFTRRISDECIRNKLITLLRTEVMRISSPGKFNEGIAYWGSYVISFCLEEDSILMWSEYSNFMGYCMAFDYKELLESFTYFNEIYHGKVVYDHVLQYKYIEESFQNELIEDPNTKYLNSWDDLNNLTDENMEDLVVWSSIICKIYNMFFKKSCYSGECEYRFIFHEIHDGGRVMDYEQQHFRIRNEVLIPFIKKPLKDLNSLKSVLIGPKNYSDITIRGVEYFLRNQKLDVDVKNSQIPLRY